MQNRFENFTIGVLKLNKLVQRIKLLEMDDYGLKAIHVMCIYYAAGRPVTAGELARLTLEDKAAISRALSLLKQNGYINYNTGKYNAEVTLTEEGKKLSEYIEERASHAVEAAGKDLTEEEREVLYKALASVSHNLEEYYNSLQKDKKQ
ncbi:MAG TPA: hypothetical protein IAB69_01135 [Candidatus Coproplasma excrementigallinarum]|uniref:HTH marR-type domain-containing protein n=1 Tax=Candidatus Coproplasma excrementigallinarum TaxID=2840747 RepID=A0A9D1MIR5_9FIRM|nr:hypothetical protein [Candidatus Coproplasma excrementigallinarum]